MTFTQLQTQVADYCNLSSPEALARIGKAINRHYRRVTSTLGLETSRFVTRSQSMTVGVATVTFTSIEKIDRLLDTTDSTAIRLLEETSIHEIRATQPGTSQPTRWATQTTGGDSVTIRTDTLPQTAYSLQADGWTTLSDLSGDQEPVFPESFHDIISWFVIAEEMLKKEKAALAQEYQSRAEQLLGDLRFHLADSPTHDTRQADGLSRVAGGAAGGSGSVGGTAYTQSALITFDLGAGVAPFAVAQATAAVVTNLDADKLDGLHAASFAALADNETVTGAWTFQGDIIIGGTTPQLTIGDAGAEDTALVFDGNAQDFYVGLDDSEDDLVLGLGSTVGTTPALSIDENRVVTLPVGQLAFPATQNASSGANTLDDYEEGTWTPTDGSGAALAFAATEAYYVKVGQFVTAWARVVYPATADGSAAVIAGLPFASLDTTQNTMVGPVLTTHGTATMIRCANNTTTAPLLIATSAAAVTNANLTGATIIFTLSYRATA